MFRAHSLKLLRRDHHERGRVAHPRAVLRAPSESNHKPRPSKQHQHRMSSCVQQRRTLVSAASRKHMGMLLAGYERLSLLFGQGGRPSGGLAALRPETKAT
eukprot:293840-Rhodomonas_salina.4